MSKSRRGANGTSQRVTGEVIQRLRAVKALWFAVHNDPDHSVADMASEFYYKVGELLEGKSLDELTFHRISKERVFDHADDT